VPSTCVIVPIKRFALAKSRLAPRLSPPRRRALAAAMAEDVLSAVTDATRTWSVAVVTGEASLAEHAERLGAAVLAEPRGGSLASALRSAATTLASLGFARFAYVPADVPLVEPADIAALIGDPVAAQSVRWVAAGRDDSVSAASWPAGSDFEIPLGAGGARQLATWATGSGVRAERLDLPHLALDLDTPDDLARLARVSTESTTRRLLESWSHVA
jgi:2-phospho-L-lactate/phosphoenolpyruvate guanylyltransferase